MRDVSVSAIEIDVPSRRVAPPRLIVRAGRGGGGGELRRTIIIVMNGASRLGARDRLVRQYGGIEWYPTAAAKQADAKSARQTGCESRVARGKGSPSVWVCVRGRYMRLLRLARELRESLRLRSERNGKAAERGMRRVGEE